MIYRQGTRVRIDRPGTPYHDCLGRVSCFYSNTGNYHVELLDGESRGWNATFEHRELRAVGEGL